MHNMAKLAAGISLVGLMTSAALFGGTAFSKDGLGGGGDHSSSSSHGQDVDDRQVRSGTGGDGGSSGGATDRSGNGSGSTAVSSNLDGSFRSIAHPRGASLLGRVPSGLFINFNDRF